MERTGPLLDNDGAFALDLALRKIFRHTFEIAGTASDDGYTLELAPHIRRDYYSYEMIEEIRALLAISGISLSVETSTQGKMNIRIFIPS